MDPCARAVAPAPTLALVQGPRLLARRNRFVTGGLDLAKAMPKQEAGPKREGGIALG